MSRLNEGERTMEEAIRKPKEELVLVEEELGQLRERVSSQQKRVTKLLHSLGNDVDNCRKFANKVRSALYSEATNLA